MMMTKALWTALAVLVLSSQAYIIVARVLRLLCYTYFRKIIVYGINHLPREGPVIICSNHPNMMVDILLVATECIKHGRRPYIWAKGALFKNPIVGFVLKCIGAVPVYRPQRHAASNMDTDCADKTPQQIQQELLQMFEATWRKLDAGHAMILFPEGTSYTAPQMLKLRTGLMRLATGFAKKYDRPIPIVPIGLTYFNKDRFRSQVVLEFGAPMQVTPAMIHATAFVEDERAEIKRLTEQLETRMRGLTLNAADYETIHLARSIRRLYLDSAVLVDTSKEVRLTQNIIDLLERFDAHKTRHLDATETQLDASNQKEQTQAKDDSLINGNGQCDDEMARGEMVRALCHKVELYANALEEARLRDQDLLLPITKDSLKDIFLERLLYLLVLVPLALPTILLNMPFFYVGNKLNRWTRYTETRSQLKIGAASVLVPTQWLLLILLGWCFVGPDCAYVLALGLPLLLYCHIRVLEEGRTFVENVRFLWNLASHQQQAELLRDQRQKLVVEVQEMAARCLDAQLLRDVAWEIQRVPSPRYRHRESKTLP